MVDRSVSDVGKTIFSTLTGARVTLELLWEANKMPPADLDAVTKMIDEACKDALLLTDHPVEEDTNVVKYPAVARVTA